MNLQTALIALGIVLIAGIYLFSRWQESRRQGSGGQRRKRDYNELAEPSFDQGGQSPDGGPVPDFDADHSGALNAHGGLQRDSTAGAEGGVAGSTGYHQPALAAEPASTSGEIPRETTLPDAGAEEMEPVSSQATAGGLGAGPVSAEDLSATDGSGGEQSDGIPVLEGRVDTDTAPWEDPTGPADGEEETLQGGEEVERNESGHETVTGALQEPADSDPPDLMIPGKYENGIDDSNADMRDQRTSLGAFLGSLKPLDRLRNSFHNRLDVVRAEREGGDDVTHTGLEPDMQDENDKSKRQVDLLDVVGERGNPRSGDDDSADGAVPDAPGDSATMESARAGPETAPGDSTSGNLSPAPGFEKISQIDYYVKLSGERDVSRDSVLAVYREAAAGVSKSHSVYGLRLPDKVWRDLEHEPEESRFGDLVVTVQLADRDGPVGGGELTRFSNLVVKLSESTGRGFSFMAPIESAQQQAETIDRFRRQFDSIFVVNIKPLEGESFDGAVIDRCAKQIGLMPDGNRFYARYKPVGKQKVCLYSLANMTDTGEFDIENMQGLTTRGVTFFTRPAVNRSPGAVFSEMVDTAKAFASRIKGEAIAPGYDELSMENVEAIRRSIENVAGEMESYGMLPGSEEASRLF